MGLTLTVENVSFDALAKALLVAEFEGWTGVSAAGLDLQVG